MKTIEVKSLNPYFSGRRFRRSIHLLWNLYNLGVLILILVEDGFGENEADKAKALKNVLILILVEDGFGDYDNKNKSIYCLCLNPYFSGRRFRSF